MISRYWSLHDARWVDYPPRWREAPEAKAAPALPESRQPAERLPAPDSTRREPQR